MRDLYILTMKIRVLGSAAGGGFPQWNCNCKNCSGLRNQTIQAKARTQSSIAVTSTDSCNWVLVNASPDILTQLKQFPEAQPARAIRDTGIRSIVLIDSQIDHTTGLLMLRESKEKLRIYCTDAVYEDLTTVNPILNVLSHYCGVDWQPIRFDSSGKSEFVVPGFENLRFTAYPLKSKAPPYSRRRANPSGGETIGVMIEDAGASKRAFYAPGLGEIENHVKPLLGSADLVMVDGTFFTENEMESQNIAPKAARSLGHLPQSGVGGMLEVLKPLHARKILIHINNTNPILDEQSPERAEVLRRGVEIAEDGMEIFL